MVRGERASHPLYVIYIELAVHGVKYILFMLPFSPFLFLLPLSWTCASLHSPHPIPSLLAFLSLPLNSVQDQEIGLTGCTAILWLLWTTGIWKCLFIHCLLIGWHVYIKRKTLRYGYLTISTDEMGMAFLRIYHLSMPETWLGKKCGCTFFPFGLGSSHRNSTLRITVGCCFSSVCGIARITFSSPSHAFSTSIPYL